MPRKRWRKQSKGTKNDSGWGWGEQLQMGWSGKVSLRRWTLEQKLEWSERFAIWRAGNSKRKSLKKNKLYGIEKQGGECTRRYQRGHGEELPLYSEHDRRALLNLRNLSRDSVLKDYMTKYLFLKIPLRVVWAMHSAKGGKNNGAATRLGSLTAKFQLKLSNRKISLVIRREWSINRDWLGVISCVGLGLPRSRPVDRITLARDSLTEMAVKPCNLNPWSFNWDHTPGFRTWWRLGSWCLIAGRIRWETNW